jgi:hypothetical protein
MRWFSALAAVFRPRPLSSEEERLVMAVLQRLQDRGGFMADGEDDEDPRAWSLARRHSLIELGNGWAAGAWITPAGRAALAKSADQ